MGHGSASAHGVQDGMRVAQVLPFTVDGPSWQPACSYSTPTGATSPYHPGRAGASVQAPVSEEDRGFLGESKDY
jgi:hypothetical protein